MSIRTYAHTLNVVENNNVYIIYSRNKQWKKCRKKIILKENSIWLRNIFSIFIYIWCNFFNLICDENIRKRKKSRNYLIRVENIQFEWKLSKSSGNYPIRVEIIPTWVEIIQREWKKSSGNYPKRVDFIQIEWKLFESSGFYPKWVEKIEWKLSESSGIYPNRVDFIQSEWK